MTLKSPDASWPSRQENFGFRDSDVPSANASENLRWFCAVERFAALDVATGHHFGTAIMNPPDNMNPVTLAKG